MNARPFLLTASERGHAGVRVLEADPDLGAGIAPDEWETALRHAVAPVHVVSRGPWSFTPAPDQGSMGALILEGLVLVRIDTGARAHLELLGEGDVMSPWVGMGPDLALPTVITSRVTSTVRLTLLDRTFSLRTARWPEIHAAIVQRLIDRARRLSLQAAINSLPRTEDRLELTLWTLAYRFGRVTPNGYMLVLRLSHSQLAEIVAASRPSVSNSLSSLREAGRVLRPEPHHWLLCGPPPERLGVLAQQTGLEP